MEVHYILRTAQNTNANLLKLCLTCWMTFMMVAPANHSLAWIRESNQKPVLFSAVASVLICRTENDNSQKSHTADRKTCQRHFVTCFCYRELVDWSGFIRVPDRSHGARQWRRALT